jgi:hypothetical protein
MLKADDQKFEMVRDFKYLASTLTEDNNITFEIKQIIPVEDLSSYGPKKEKSSLHLRRQAKCDLYKMLARSILTHGSESWSLRREDENMLGIFERRILKRIYGSIKENAIWRSRCNHELYKLYNQ